MDYQLEMPYFIHLLSLSLYLPSLLTKTSPSSLGRNLYDCSHSSYILLIFPVTRRQVQGFNIINKPNLSSHKPGKTLPVPQQVSVIT